MSGFQVQFGGDVHTPGDRVDVLVAMNPAALKTHLKDLMPAESSSSTGTPSRPPSWPRPATRPTRWRTVRCDRRRLVAVPITTLNREAAADRAPAPPPLLSQREVDRCKNFFALGLVYWLFERPLEPTLRLD